MPSKPLKPRGRIAGSLMLDCRARRLANEIERGGDADEIHDTAALAAELGCSTQFLEALRMPSRGVEGPAFIRFGTMVGYRRDDVVSWLKARAELYDRAHPPKASAQPMKIIRGTAR